MPAAKAPKSVRRAAPRSRAELEQACQRSDESACMELGRQMIKNEVRKDPARAREMLQQVKEACSAGDSEACDALRALMKRR
jgi:TPR repeat protein